MQNAHCSQHRWPFPTVVAHRGAGTLAPENTLAAMRRGMDFGFRAVEFDAMLARDGVPVLMHDLRLGRTVAGEGGMENLDSTDLREMDAGSWFGPEYAGEPVPLLAEVLAFCRANGIWMNVEIKPVPGFEAQTGRAVADCVARAFAIDAGGDIGRLPLLSSFSFEALAAAKACAPWLPRGFLLDRIGAEWRGRCEALGAMAVHTNHKTLSPNVAAEVKAAGYGLFCYTVNDPDEARLLRSWGVDSFCTDRIDLIGPAFS